MLSLWGGTKKVLTGEPDKLLPALIKEEGECLLLGSGIPGATVDACAYEPLQKLLAVATSDGRVKLFGHLGVEKTLYSSAKKVSSTRQLLFLPNRGILLRLSKVQTRVMEGPMHEEVHARSPRQRSPTQPIWSLRDSPPVRFSKLWPCSSGLGRNACMARTCTLRAIFPLSPSSSSSLGTCRTPAWCILEFISLV